MKMTRQREANGWSHEDRNEKSEQIKTNTNQCIIFLLNNFEGAEPPTKRGREAVGGRRPPGSKFAVCQPGPCCCRVTCQPSIYARTFVRVCPETDTPGETRTRTPDSGHLGTIRTRSAGTARLFNFDAVYIQFLGALIRCPLRDVA